MYLCRYKVADDDTFNVIWAGAAWNMRMVTEMNAVNQAGVEKSKKMRSIN